MQWTKDWSDRLERRMANGGAEKLADVTADGKAKVHVESNRRKLALTGTVTAFKARVKKRGRS